MLHWLWNWENTFLYKMEIPDILLSRNWLPLPAFIYAQIHRLGLGRYAHGTIRIVTHVLRFDTYLNTFSTFCLSLAAMFLSVLFSFTAQYINHWIKLLHLQAQLFIYSLIHSNRMAGTRQNKYNCGTKMRDNHWKEKNDQTSGLE